MKDIITITKYTIKENITKKSFIISTLIILVLIVAGFNVPNIIKSFNGSETDGVQEKLLIVDNDGIFEGNLELLKQTDFGYQIELQNATFEEIKENSTKNSL